jgi:hypothetical protein
MKKVIDTALNDIVKLKGVFRNQEKPKDERFWDSREDSSRRKHMS